MSAAPGVRLDRAARLVSVALHPFALALVLAAGVEAPRGCRAAAHTVGAVALLFVLPLALLVAERTRRGRWSDVDASRPRDRPILFAIGGVGLLALLVFLSIARPRSALPAGVAGVLAMVAVCAVLTRWTKVSLHVATLALAAAVLLGRGLALGWALAMLVPVLGWSRVRLGRHRWVEVVLGAAIGAAAGAAIVRWAGAGTAFR